MGKGGKYLNKKPAAAKKKGKKKILFTILIVLLVIVVLCVAAGVLYYNYMLSLIVRPEDNVPVPTQTMEAATEATEEPTVGTTSPEDTWPVVVSDKNITNIMLVGQAAREGEEARIADTMILCSINRETKTLTMTSLMRDLRLVWPEYVDVNGKKHTGNNRINMAYNMGTRWDNNVSGGMNVMESIVEYNFGVEVDHTVEVNFDMFQMVVDKLGGLDVEMNADEVKYMKDNFYYFGENEKLKEGVNHLDGYQTLCYARMRKVGHGDFERTERQRIVISLILNELKDLNILKVHKIFTSVLPNITTNMTNQEITNYAFEFIPMLRDLKIQSQRIPFDDTYWNITVNIEGQETPDNQLQCDVEENARLLKESLGIDIAE